MVDVDADGRIREIQIKPDRTDLKFTWIFAVWTSVFTDFMHEYILTCGRQIHKIRASLKGEDQHEMFIGDVVQAAIDNGLLVESVIFSDGSYLDIGTPTDLVKAVRENPYADIFKKEGLDSPKLHKLRGYICAFPDYLIVGAQKCGTSSVYQQLIQHPCVEKGFMPYLNTLKKYCSKAITRLMEINYYSARGFYKYMLNRSHQRYKGSPLLIYQMGKVGSKYSSGLTSIP